MSKRTPASAPCPMCASSKAERVAYRPRDGRDWYLAHCGACGFYFTDPPPTALDIQSFYAGDYHAELREKGATERAFGPKFRGYLEWLLPQVNRGRSLDIGCATGLLVKLLKDAGFEAEGFEANEASAAWGRENYGIPIQAGVFDPATGPKNAYSLISMCDVLEHTINPLQYLRALCGLLRPGGHVFITFPDILSAESRYFRFLATALGRDWLWRSCNVPYHTWEFTRETATRTFEEAGFQVAAFRRQQDSVLDGKCEKGAGAGIVHLLGLPPRVIEMKLLGRAFGTQMHFLIQVR